MSGGGLKYARGVPSNGAAAHLRPALLGDEVDGIAVAEGLPLGEGRAVLHEVRRGDGGRPRQACGGTSPLHLVTDPQGGGGRFPLSKIPSIAW